MAKDDEMKESGNGVPPLFSQSQDTPIGFFAPDEPVANLSGNLPHWCQDNTTYFVTFRLADGFSQNSLQLPRFLA